MERKGIMDPPTYKGKEKKKKKPHNVLYYVSVERLNLFVFYMF